MTKRQLFLCAALSVSLLLTGCFSPSQGSENLVLKGTFSDEVVTLDPRFLARQKLAEKNFFGGHSDNHAAVPYGTDDDDESLVPDNTNLAENSSPIRQEFRDFEMIWPTKGRLTSLFGRRVLGHKARQHAGIDIGAAKGTPITAAADGQILFVGRKRGYGFSVIIAHDNNHETLYAHMSRMVVRPGQFVTRGKLIGFVGKTGHVTGANLHFETRINGIAYNPMEFLPSGLRGKIRVGMQTPSAAEQKKFYTERSRFAFQKE